MRPIIEKPLDTFDAEGFRERVKRLKASGAKGSKAVPGIAILRGRALIVRISRRPREFTEDEIGLLATEYNMTKDQVFELLTARKVRILNKDLDVINAPAKKADARGKRKRRPMADSDELLKPGPAADLPQEGLLPAGQEPLKRG